MISLNTNKNQNDQRSNSGHEAQQATVDASADMKRTQAWDHLEKLISELREFVQPKINVHKEIKTKVASIGSAFKRLKVLEDARLTDQSRSKLTPIVSGTPLHRVQSVTETTTTIDSEFETDLESVIGEERGTRRTKRKERSPPESGSKKAKKMKGTGPTPLAENTTQTEWQTVKSKKEKKKPQKKKLRQSVGRPNALIVRPKEKENYADILSRVKKDVPDEQVRSTVDKIRRTATGDLLIILTKESTDKGQGLQKTIAKLLGNEAEVISKGPQEEIEIRDLDDTTTKQDVLEALQKAAEDDEITLDAIRSLRKAYGGTQTASVTLAATIARKVLGEHGKIRIGWVNCRIKIVERPTKCFRCWHYGHLAAKCNSNVDRSNLCTSCGEEGHKTATCKKDARCALCLEKGNTKNCAHIAGSSRCPVFKEALQKVRKKKQL
ncbi:unnamed protein product [Euphydryas editha]|uniref:CCHC-type domain-containing protein n=1 Tax=Euphydryas editha TaxID=104508 RepID=A0AAU9U2C2_EUPED|nr:unnamed protein product [Euphydryas editha]